MTTYSISLDNVDLALLPLRTYKYNDFLKKGTYKYNDFLKKEYYQFEVMRKEDAEEPMETILYTCYICAIEVPAAFANEHTASIKHQANARIADVAMKRVSSGIFCLPPPNTERSSARFCANCATVANEDHDDTKEHRVAVMHDNLLWDLMKAYINESEQNVFHVSSENGVKSKEEIVNHKDIDKDDDSVSTVINDKLVQAPAETEKQKKVKKKGTVDKSVTINLENNEKSSTRKDQEGIVFDTWKTTSAKESELNTSINQVITSSLNEAKKKVENGIQIKLGHDKTDGQSQVHYVLPTTSRVFPSPEVQHSTIINKVDTEELGTSHNSQHYALILALRYTDSKKPFEFKESNKRICLKINDNTLNVDSDHFHSYQRDNNGDVQCIVCDCDLDNEDAEAHKYYMIHMSRISNIGNDDHYVREVNDIYSHCILCNKKVDNNTVTMHKRAMYHVLRKQIMTKNDNNDIKQDTEQENEKQNKQLIPTIDANSAPDIPIEMANDELEETKIEFPFEEASDDLINCVVCNRKLPRDKNSRKVHIKGSKHLKNLSARVKGPSLTYK